MFSPQQEIALGDVEADYISRFLQPIEAKELTGYLERMGDRLVKHLPPTGLQFRFFLSNEPIANAFSIGGGRVYVTRKLIGYARSEDELGGILGHELGHIVTHQNAITFTKIFHERLGISQVTDRKDIFEKFNRLLDERHKFQPIKVKGEEEQQEADRVGLEATVRAGYAPQALADFFDRLTENKGKTGTWYSELFGTTPPDAKRLREMGKLLAKLPTACREIRPSNPGEDFLKWKAAVVAYSGLGHPENLHGVVWKKDLEPPLQDGIHVLKFSPDGKYVLAQDSGSIYILTREPFQPLFRIDALDAYPAQFTPDSRGVVFYNPGLRVEQWNIGTKQQTDVQEVVVKGGCLQTLLSPDGKMLACVRGRLDLDLVDVASGEHVLEKRDFFTAHRDLELGINKLRFFLRINYLSMGFSTDGRYFVASLRGEKSLVFDVTQRREIPIQGAVKDVIGTAFSFTGPDSLVGYGGAGGEKSALVRFPSGEVLKRLELGAARPSAVTRGDFVLLRPIRDYEVGVLDMNTNEIIRASKTPALDIYDKQVVSELKNGNIGLFGDSTTPLAEATLPRGGLGRLQTAALSEDAGWLALSERYRGGVWNMDTGTRILNLRQFKGAFIREDGTFYADFPKHDSTVRSIAKVALQQRQFGEAMKPEGEEARQVGPYLLTTRPVKETNEDAKKKPDENRKVEAEDTRPEGLNLRIRESDFRPEVNRNSIVEVRDLPSGSLLWSRTFPMETPRHFADWRDKTLVLIWRADEAAAKAELNQHPEWKSRLPHPKEDDLLLEALDLETGKSKGGFLLSTGEGSFLIERVRVSGDWVVIDDSEGRTLVYALSSGQEKGKIFGDSMGVSKTGGVLCIESGPEKLALYDMASMTKLDEFAFSSAVRMVQFLNDGKRLFVLTSRQSAYLLEPSLTPSRSQAN